MADLPNGISGSSSWNSPVNPSKVVTGAKIKFIMPDGTPVAYAQAVSYNITHELAPVYGLDRLSPYEYAETGYSVTFSVTRFRLHSATGTNDTSPIGMGWQSPLGKILTQGCIKAIFQLDLAKVTSTAGQSGAVTANPALLTIDGVKMTSRAGNFTARELSSETLDFVGLVAYDENTPTSDIWEPIA